MKKNKRGIMLDNVLSLILFAICFALIIAGVFIVTKIYVANEEENAKNFINILEAKINNLKDGEIGRFTMTGVEGWFLTGWGSADLNRPDKCFFKSCICVCKGGKRDISSKNINSEKSRLCQDTSFSDNCRQVNQEKVDVFGELVFYEGGPSAIAIDQGYLIAQEFIVLPKNLFEIEVNKTKMGELIIKKNE